MVSDGKTPRTLKSKLRKIATAIISSLICVSILFGADLYLHRKHGINLSGYRGPSVGRKEPGEKRIAMLGGSTTWGFGLRAGQSVPAQLQQMLNNDGQSKINVLNLGFNGEGAYSFTQTLNDYDYLNADLVIFYSGYNDVHGPNYFNSRHRSPVFAWTGYLPLLPSFTIDKLTVWKRETFDKDKRVVFTPPKANQQSRYDALRQQLKEIETSPPGDPSATGCSQRWQFYCDRIVTATELALAKGERVLVVTEPYIVDAHVQQQSELARLLKSRFAAEPRVRYVNLGETIDLRDPSLCWDGMHLTEEGNRRIAAALREPALEMLR